MREITKARLKRLVVGVVVGLQLNTVAFYAWADGITAGAELGQQTVRSSIQAFDPESANVTLQELFPDLAPDSTSNLEAVFGNDKQTTEVGQKANERLLVADNEEGDAYRILQGYKNRIQPDLSKDPMFNVGDQVRNPDYMKEFNENFADCKKTDVFEEVQRPAHVAKYRSCERLHKPVGNCDIFHEILIESKPADVVFIVDNSGSMSGVIKSLKASVGNFAKLLSDDEGGFRVGGVASGGSRHASNNIMLTSNVDSFRGWLDNIGSKSGTNTVLSTNWVIDNFNWRPDVERVVAIIGNEDGPGGNVPALVGKLKAHNIQAYIFHDNGGVRQIGTFITSHFSATALFKFAQFLTIVGDSWGPEQCIADARSTLEEFCEGSYAETEGGKGGCVNISGFDVCPGDHIYKQLKEPPLPGLSKLTKKAKVSQIQCDYNVGQMECWTDPQGKQHCPDNKGGNNNTCEQFEQNPECGFVSQSCLGNATGSLGTCYIFNEIWDCGYDLSYPTVVNTGQLIECPGGARCMGSECFDNSNVKSGDFAYAAAMLQVAQFAEHDLDCGGEGGLDCKVFKGEAMECKKALGGYVDCCEAPESVSIFDYVNLTMNTLKMTSSIEALQRGQYAAGSGYWAASGSAIAEGATKLISGEWGSIVDSATGAFQKTFTEGAQSAITSKIQQWLMQKAYDAMVEMGASTAANAVFQTGTNAAGEATIGLSSNAAMVVNIIGWVYMVYVIVDLLINIIWECEEKEFELGAKKETRQCHFVGSYCASKVLGSCVEKRETYCCFGSVVGRIIQESARDQLGLGWGETETPSCDGITPAQMSLMDWKKVDLSEWIGMLSMADRLPTMNTVSLDHLTGEGSRLQISESDTRLNSLDRNMERFKDFDPDEVKKKAEQELR